MIRDAVAGDYAALGQIFYDAVHIGAAEHYSVVERAAWMPEVPTADGLRTRMEGTLVFVADRDEIIEGFMSLTTDGVVDMAYVRPDLRGRGVAFALYRVIEDAAKTRGLDRLKTFASHLAKPFFLRQGWHVMRPNRIERRGVSLHNWVMEKEIAL